MPADRQRLDVNQDLEPCSIGTIVKDLVPLKPHPGVVVAAQQVVTDSGDAERDRIGAVPSVLPGDVYDIAGANVNPCHGCRFGTGWSLRVVPWRLIRSDLW